MEELLSALVGLFIVGGLLSLVVLALVWQRKGLSTQRDAMSHIEESLELSRRNLELQEEANALAEQSLRYQREILEALRALGGRGAVESNIRAFQDVAETHLRRETS